MADAWDAVDAYFAGALFGKDAVLDAALAASRAGGLPDIAVAPNQGMLLNVLARAVKAERILEVGTLGGYSSIWLARALPKGGKLITLEVEKRHADVARANFARADLAEVIEVRVGRGIDLLPKLAAENPKPFDLVFIDADKPSNADYFDWAMKLTHKGSIIIVDNVVRGGHVADPKSTDPNVKGVHRLVEHLKAEKRVMTSALQTVGIKGYDGFTISVVV
ncbi:MAG TPA: O-methyltransferase [Bauldia sp.]|nr:O-methyltransferase [Bauldia sp.]